MESAVKGIWHCSITPQDVYGSATRGEILSVLHKQNMRVVDFRPPKAGNIYIMTHVETATCTSDTAFSSREPRLILEPIQPRIGDALSEWWPTA